MVKIKEKIANQIGALLERVSINTYRLFLALREGYT
jgi:hypothetical protein